MIWFHCASLGEFEQGRPIIEEIYSLNSKHNSKFNNYKIILTFFSPSGYEIRKDYKYADVVCYLPLDTKKNVKRFLDLAHPNIAIFVKYEFWPNILIELHNRKIHTLLVSGIFRTNQIFFKKGFFANVMQEPLKTFNHFFVQDNTSKELLNRIHINNVTISGDTRFDRVYEITKQDNSIDFIADFTQNKHVLVAGSTWKKDEELLVNYINNFATSNEKFIIAPHNIKDIDNLKNSIHKKVTLFSDKKRNNNAQVFIVDTVGMLTKIYSYADVAYIGGGFEKGIHNILEPATFGVPIIIGPKYQKFNEAVALVKLKACFVVQNETCFVDLLNKLKTDTEFKIKSGTIAKNYIINNIGATNIIIDYIKNCIL